MNLNGDTVTNIYNKKESNLEFQILLSCLSIHTCSFYRKHRIKIKLILTTFRILILNDFTKTYGTHLAPSLLASVKRA